MPECCLELLFCLVDLCFPPVVVVWWTGKAKLLVGAMCALCRNAPYAYGWRERRATSSGPMDAPSLDMHMTRPKLQLEKVHKPRGMGIMRHRGWVGGSELSCRSCILLVYPRRGTVVCAAVVCAGLGMWGIRTFDIPLGR